MVRALTDKNRMSLLFPKVAKQWHPILNGDLTPNDISYGSNKVVWWLCGNGHEWEDTVNHRCIGSRGCPGCSGHKVYEDNCLATVNPELAAQWHPTLNGELTPKDVTKSSDKVVWWVCEKGHEWGSNITNRTNGNGCPGCSGKKAYTFQTNDQRELLEFIGGVTEFISREPDAKLRNWLSPQEIREISKPHDGDNELGFLVVGPKSAIREEAKASTPLLEPRRAPQQSWRPSACTVVSTVVFVASTVLGTIALTWGNT